MQVKTWFLRVVCVNSYCGNKYSLVLEGVCLRKQTIPSSSCVFWVVALWHCSRSCGRGRNVQVRVTVSLQWTLTHTFLKIQDVHMEARKHIFGFWSENLTLHRFLTFNILCSLNQYDRKCVLFSTYYMWIIPTTSEKVTWVERFSWRVKGLNYNIYKVEFPKVKYLSM